MSIHRFLRVAVFLMSCCGMAAHAHKPSDSYLTLHIADHTIEGQWDIALRDLEYAIGIDSDGNGELTWDEVRAKHADIAAYALSRLRLSSAGAACHVTPHEQLIDRHSDGAYAVLRFTAACATGIESLELQYKLLFDLDPQHRGLVQLEHAGQTSTAIFSPDHAQQHLQVAQAGHLQQFVDYFKHGVWHIWIGFDHILFLLSLLLPAVLVFNDRQWESVNSFRDAFVDVLKIVTAFTLAHSITLTLATLQFIMLPSRWVESAIAASVIVAALNNLFPVFRGQRWTVAFAFGLIHGFGFASVLSDLGLPRSSLLLALVGFNLGVEAGQLAIVAAFLPFAYVVRQSWLYRRLVLNVGSCAIVMVATMWLYQRVFNN